jgi:hypothetical protein
MTGPTFVRSGGSGIVREQAGQRFAIGYWDSTEANAAAAAIEAIDDPAFDRYDNPFEQKWALRDKFRLPPAVDAIVHGLERAYMDVGRLLGAELIPDRGRHYMGVFRYEPGDRLDVHVDAGIHPGTGHRKHATILVYLGNGAGNLELWEGTSSTDEVAPRVRGVIDVIPPSHGRVVLFENNDHAWHGVRPNSEGSGRLVVTVSYLSLAIDRWDNRRERAFFVPRPDEEWDEATYALRDVRADPDRHAEVYRAGVSA